MTGRVDQGYDPYRDTYKALQGAGLIADSLPTALSSPTVKEALVEVLKDVAKDGDTSAWGNSKQGDVYLDGDKVGKVIAKQQATVRKSSYLADDAMTY